MMIVGVFEGVSGNYGFTQDGTGANLPAEFGPWKLVKTMDFNVSPSRTALNVNEALSATVTDGFYVTKTGVVFTEFAA